MTCEAPIPLNFLGSVIQGPPGELKAKNALLVFDSYEKAQAAAKTLIDSTIEIKVDETRNNFRTRYQVIDGALAYQGIAAAFEHSKQILLSWTVLEENISTDNTAILSQALNAAFADGSTLIVDINIATTEISILSGKGGVVCANGKKIYAHANASQADIYGNPLLNFGSATTGSYFDLDVDINGLSKSGVSIAGADSTVVRSVVRNIYASAGRTSQLFGTNVSGHRTKVGVIAGFDLRSADTMLSGGGTFSLTNYAQDVTVDRIVSIAGFCAYLGNGWRPTIDMIYSDGCTDNCIYSISGSRDFVCNTLVARNCVDEVCVFSGSDTTATYTGNTNPYVGKIVAYNCQRGLGLLAASKINVGEIEWWNDGSVASGSPLYIRPGATDKIDRVTINSMKIFGTWSAGAPLWTLEGAGIGLLRIDSLFARLEYTNPTATKNLAFSTGIDSIMLGDVDVEVIDKTGTLTSADVFRLPLGTLTKSSSIKSTAFSNGGGAHSVRMLDVAQDALRIGGIPTVRGDLNPPFVGHEASAQSTRTYGSGAAPTQGTWKRGDIVWNQFPTATGTVGWICITAGTPGTWVEFGAIGAASSGSWTPALTIVSNLDAATAQSAQFMRIGRMVTVSGTLLLDPTAAGAISVRLSPPVNSNFTGAFQCGGTAAAVDGTIVGVVTADSVNKQLLIGANATVTSARNVTFHATYHVL